MVGTSFKIAWIYIPGGVTLMVEVMTLMERYWGRIWRGRDGEPISKGNLAETILGRRGKVEWIDAWGFTTFEGEKGSHYVPYLVRVKESEHV